MNDPLWILVAGMVVVVGGILGLRLHAFPALLIGALVVGAFTPRSALEAHALSKGRTLQQARADASISVGTRIAKAFGDTVSNIGILIAMAAIIGKCLLDSGAADRIVRSALRGLGERRAPVCFLGSGFMLGIPVFADTVFYLLIPLAKALAARTARNYTLLILAIVAGTTMSHSLVPPTPGPLLVANLLNVNIGHLMIAGIVIGSAASVSGYAYACWANRRWPIPLRESSEVSLIELQLQADRTEQELPPLWLAWLPILLPLVLISGDAVLSSASEMARDTGAASLPANFIRWFGDKNLALMLAAAIALAMLVRWKRPGAPDAAAAVQSALTSGGIIILVTSAGGAFGGMLQQSGLGGRIEELSAALKLGALPLAFLVTALIRTAQGSATVAMITAVGVLEGFANPAQLGFHPVYLAAAIGCGSKLVPWMNDSGFWIICKMSGFTEAETFKTFSVTLTIMGCTGLLVTMVLARVFPFH
ncbi:MAG: GntP family permease [Verrucomicrobia bacterium]|nr:GntP family permease [Verrucomicrobiota bacterium]